MSDKQNEVAEKQGTAESAEQPQPSAEDVRELAELLRLTRELRQRVLLLAKKGGAGDAFGHEWDDEPPFHRTLRGMVYHLAEATISANAYLVGQLLGDANLKCVCGGGEWKRYAAIVDGGDEPTCDEPACAECQCCGLRMSLGVFPKPPQPPAESYQPCTNTCTCPRCSDNIPF